MPTKTSKSELGKIPTKPKQIDPVPEKSSKKTKSSSSRKPVSSKKVEHQLKEAEVDKVQKKKTRSSDAISGSKKTSLKKANSSTELKHKSSLPSKNATKKSKQASNAAIITTSKTATNVKKREQTDRHEQTIKPTDKKKSTSKKLKKQSSAHTLPSLLTPSPIPPSTPIATKRPSLKQCVSRATSTSIGIDMSTQTDPIVETQQSKPNYQSQYLDLRDLVPINALKITLEEFMDSMQIVEKQRTAIPIKKQATTIKSKIRKALKKSIKF
ncbi:hypothetical protein HMPREF1544_01269 [Mucor circinelloides 1006PhL]|uniref:Uncharacterized protein n=1 Tax=Mucor circinelloides f. circinelloides (strain 1006PhL) TaxID=1220926 RepID=S2KHU1_MUCC1|nr:hypothetical protein HMPREF1544_01269 [Mucor circinelloides 1006PhL]KAG1094960.1 hypothetical protein G6F42_018644 [Rhizopus arrhizus]